MGIANASPEHLASGADQTDTSLLLNDSSGAMATTPFQTEAWAEYGLGVFVLLLRFFSRWKTVGFKNWEGDDYFAILVLVFWTVRGRGLIAILAVADRSRSTCSSS